MSKPRNRVKRAAEPVREKAATADGAAAESTEAASGQEAATASEVLEQAEDAGRRAGAAVSRQYDRMSHSAQDAYGEGREMATEWTQSLEGYARRKPLMAVFIAGCVGFLLGLALGRKT
jgi:ElaB/YqjD/DUF883 family membrane-anchored ribosome-binding protein